MYAPMSGSCRPGSSRLHNPSSLSQDFLQNLAKSEFAGGTPCFSFELPSQLLAWRFSERTISMWGVQEDVEKVSLFDPWALLEARLDRRV